MEKQARIRQNKFNPCFHEKTDPIIAENQGNQIDLYYPFASEYNDLPSFLKPLSSSDYIIKDRYLNPLSSFDGRSISQEIQINNYSRLCKKCENDSQSDYEHCTSRPFVSFQNTIDLDISDHSLSGSLFHCEYCGYSLFISPNCINDSPIYLRDVRLSGRPAALKITRHRLRCTRCNRLQEEEELIGIQAFCNSTLTSRLASAVLFEHLSNIKRQWIAEAYGISINQIDRITKQMIEKSAGERLKRAYAEIMSGRSHRVEYRDIDLKGEKYVAYFVTEGQNNVKLINILPMSVRLALQKKPDLSNTALKGMSKNAYLLACYCCLAAERKMDGKDLMDALSDCEKRFTSPQDIHFNFFQLSNQRKDIVSLLSYSHRELPKIVRIVERDDGQMMLMEMQASPSEGKQEQGAFATALDRFVLALSTSVKGRLSPKKLTDILLDFNPAAVSHLEIKLFTGDSTSEYPADLLRSEGSCMYEKAWGVPVPCLTYLVRNGILRNQQRGHIPCYLRSDPAEVSKNSKEGLPLPCGMTNIACPHCQRV